MKSEADDEARNRSSVLGSRCYGQSPEIVAPPRNSNPVPGTVIIIPGRWGTGSGLFFQPQPPRCHDPISANFHLPPSPARNRCGSHLCRRGGLDRAIASGVGHQRDSGGDFRSVSKHLRGRRYRDLTYNWGVLGADQVARLTADSVGGTPNRILSASITFNDINNPDISWFAEPTPGLMTNSPAFTIGPTVTNHTVTAASGDVDLNLGITYESTPGSPACRPFGSADHCHA